MNLINKSFDFVTRKQAEDICRIDSNLFTKKPQEFIKANAETWYVLVNTWLLMIDEYSERTRILATEYLLKEGLVALIKNGDALASDIMHGGIDCTRDNHVWLYLLQDIADSVDRERVVLTLLRFAKRLSPAKADLVNESSLNSFLLVNDQNYKQYFNFDCPGQYGRRDKITPNFDMESKCFLWNEIKAEYRQLLPWTASTSVKPDEDGLYPNPPIIAGYVREFNEDLFDCYWEHERHYSREFQWKLANKYALEIVASLGEFSNGSTYEGAKTLKEKLLQYAMKEPNWDSCPLYPTQSHPRHVSEDWEEDHLCKVLAVPKSFKTARIIAKEQTRRAYFMQGLRKLWVDWLDITGDSTYVDVEDQEPNQEACRIASIDKGMVTVDMSHASDSISYTLGAILNGPWFDQYIYRPYASHYLDLPGGVRRRSNIYFTSGSPCTFIFESCFFLAVARAATHYVNLWITMGDRRRKKCLEPRTFGDDVLIDERAYDLYLLLLTQLGCCVNVDKTFGSDSDYRESCGVEYRNGYPLHTIKWPRNCFSITKERAKPEDLASLISLQHKVFDTSWKASRFLTQYVRSHIPGMTSSQPYTECDDLWEEIPRYVLELARGAQMSVPKNPAEKQRFLSQVDKAYTREIHMSLVSTYAPVAKHDPDTEMYRYVKFLKEGPTYASPLDKLLGVSQHPSRSAQLVKPTQKWQPITR